ncbi:hypothetical protein EII17_01855 [Clostridiales bacterium COT073_COT-073]|nr:hypothetical protein EII17_01855 [Clostridiales bacterium COT073_COT-073]
MCALYFLRKPFGLPALHFTGNTLQYKIKSCWATHQQTLYFAPAVPSVLLFAGEAPENINVRFVVASIFPFRDMLRKIAFGAYACVLQLKIDDQKVIK